MAYIDFGSITGGMSDTVKAIGAISDLGQKLKYGDREAEAEIMAKEATANRATTEAEKSQMELDIAQKAREQEAFTVKQQQSNIMLNRMRQEIQQNSKLGTPISKDSFDTALKYLSGNQALTSNIKTMLDTGDATGVNSFRDLAKRAFTAGNQYMQDGKIDNEELQGVKGLYIELAKYKDPKFNLTTNDITMDDSGVWKVDANGNKIEQIEKMNPMDMVKNLTLQEQALGALVGSYNKQYQVDNFDKYTKEHRTYISNTEELHNLASMLPAAKGQVILNTYQMASPEELGKALPKLREDVIAHMNSKDLELIKTGILGQKVVSAKTGTSFGETVNTYSDWFNKHGIKNPDMVIDSANNMVNNWLSDPKNAAFAAERGYTKEQLISAITTGQLKQSEEVSKASKAALEPNLVKSQTEAHKAEAALKRGQLGQLGKKTNSFQTDLAKETFKSNEAQIKKLTEQLNDPIISKNTKTSNQIKENIANLQRQNFDIYRSGVIQPPSTPLNAGSEVPQFGSTKQPINTTTTPTTQKAPAPTKEQVKKSKTAAADAVREAERKARANLKPEDYRYVPKDPYKTSPYEIGGLGNGIGSSFSAIGGAIGGSIGNKYNSISDDFYVPRTVDEKYLSVKDLIKKRNLEYIKNGGNLKNLQRDPNWDPLG